MRRPDPSEYHEYYGRYIDLVPDGDVLDTLASQMEETRALLATVPPELEEYRYAEGKWSVREVVGHLMDTERVFAFRGLWVARGAAGDQLSMDQEEWGRTSNAGRRRLAALTEDWAGLRADTIRLFGSLDQEAWGHMGTASGRPFTTRAFPWIIAGHELYHRALLKRDYGVGGGA